MINRKPDPSPLEQDRIHARGRLARARRRLLRILPLALLPVLAGTLLIPARGALRQETPRQRVEVPQPYLDSTAALAARHAQRLDMAFQNDPATVDSLPESIRHLEISGVELARRQIIRGLHKDIERQRRRDQSIQGLRDVILDSQDPEIRAFLPATRKLQRLLENRRSDTPRSYTSDFIRDFTPIARLIERHSGIPAEIILAQIVVESGWGGSNITILKNNILGIGNRARDEDFNVKLKLGDFEREIRVRTLDDTTAFAFDSIADGIFYYAYVLLQSPENAVHYGNLRRYLREHRDTADLNPRAYRHEVLKRIARSYHSNPEWYTDYVETLIADSIAPATNGADLAGNF